MPHSASPTSALSDRPHQLPAPGAPSSTFRSCSHPVGLLVAQRVHMPRVGGRTLVQGVVMIAICHVSDNSREAGCRASGSITTTLTTPCIPQVPSEPCDAIHTSTLADQSSLPGSLHHTSAHPAPPEQKGTPGPGSGRAARPWQSAPPKVSRTRGRAVGLPATLVRRAGW
ncbi:hypothetical protein EJ04DRAFT_527774 [Polyplosphaeria fusca]|uniref:Uncharacterized protein n=1 Tax=Polyplosphaeria fusca TaxID=682080 RepID=A0A9P4UYQ7_9PLEO|nr:hypothetical protein EJ04DRAFT_527774 [Polyplosphaeria fusca]